MKQFCESWCAKWILWNEDMWGFAVLVNRDIVLISPIVHVVQTTVKSLHTHTSLLFRTARAAWVHTLWICFQMDWYQSMLDTLGCSVVQQHTSCSRFCEFDSSFWQLPSSFSHPCSFPNLIFSFSLFTPCVLIFFSSKFCLSFQSVSLAWFLSAIARASCLTLPL